MEALLAAAVVGGDFFGAVGSNIVKDFFGSAALGAAAGASTGDVPNRDAGFGPGASDGVTDAALGAGAEVRTGRSQVVTCVTLLKK